MTLGEVAKVLEAEILTQEIDLDTEVSSAFASDLMSDVLAFSGNANILITGLCNPQIIRTAEMLDYSCVILARGKKAPEDLQDLAQDCNICLMTSNMLVFSICATLSDCGIIGGGKNV